MALQCAHLARHPSRTCSNGQFVQDPAAKKIKPTVQVYKVRSFEALSSGSSTGWHVHWLRRGRCLPTLHALPSIPTPQCPDGECDTLTGYFGQPVGSSVGITGVANLGTPTANSQTVTCKAGWVFLGIDTARYNATSTLGNAARLIRVGCGVPQVRCCGTLATHQWTQQVAREAVLSMALT